MEGEAGGEDRAESDDCVELTVAKADKQRAIVSLGKIKQYNRVQLPPSTQMSPKLRADGGKVSAQSQAPAFRAAICRSSSSDLFEIN